MANYKLRDDIVIEKVDRIYIFVALRSAWNECPFAVQSSSATALICELLKKGYDEEQVIQRLSKEKKITLHQADKIFRFFIRKSREFHYLVEENEPC